MSDEHKLSRRAFLGVSGAVGLAAGCSSKPVAQKLYPFLTPPEEIIPGTPVFYRTACRGCAAGCGVTAKTREGRVIKLEGNPDDPIGRGALCARGQAAVQELYAPDRLRGPLQRDPSGKLVPVGWDAALARLAEVLGKAKASGSEGRVRLVSRPEPGSAGQVQRDFISELKGRRSVFEPFDLSALRAAGAILFERPELPAFDLSRARSVVALGADFLETWLSPVELTRGFTAGRGRIGPERTRLTWIGPRLSATAGSADRWLRARAGSEAAVALGVLRWLVDPKNGVSDLRPEAADLLPRVAGFDLETVEKLSGVPGAELVRLCQELASRRPSALLGPGPSSAGADATELAVAIQLVNYVLGNVDRTVLYGLDPRLDTPSPYSEIQGLIAEMGQGKVDVLFVHHADLVGATPASSGAAAALEKVGLVVSFSDRLDATTARAHLVLPDHHALESFGDVSPRKGVVELVQPAMRPLGDTRAASEVLLGLSSASKKDFYEYQQARLTELVKDDAPRREAQQRGVIATEAQPEPVALRPNAVSAAFAPPKSPEGDGFALLVFPTSLRGDGRAGPLPWLSEVPDVTSTVAWTTWVEVSPASAQRLGIETEDVVELTSPAGKIELPAYVYPGLRDDTVAVPLGSAEALALLPSSVEAGSGGLAWQGTRVSLRRTGKSRSLALLEGIPEPKPEAQIIEHVSEEKPAVVPLPQAPSMYPPIEHPKHRWAMSIDLDRCTGCQACVVACYAENNVPVVGPELSAQGRNMAWLRIERYFDPDPKEGVDFLPMLCQQCGNAPCEPVCPVYATYHTEEGLNAQVYNRCVGTRYCSNNCPYKVRTFNYRDPVFPSPLDFQLNPDVSVRAKGVMEKCTFCVQRVRYGENQARDDGRAVADGEIVPACAQTCPGQAIVFGDANDPNARVNAARRDPRGYRVLEELNTAPAITYLARVKGGKP